MSITTFQYPQQRIYKSRLGDLSIPRHRQRNPTLFPIATGGQVGVEITRATAAQGLRLWRGKC